MSRDFYHELNALLAQNADSLVSVQTQKMDSLLEQTGKSFVLFGAGRLGRITLAGLRDAGVEPLAFADNSPNLWGKWVDGVKVFSPQDAKQQFVQKALFVTTVYTSTPVRHQLEELKVRCVSFAELAWYYPHALLPHYATDLPHAIFEQADDVRQALDVWADDASRNEYLAQLAWRTLLDPTVLPPWIKPQEMYFQTNFFSFSPDDILVDCGAFDGDTLRELARQKINYQRLIAIEPDPLNFRILEEYVSTLPESVRTKILLFQKAIGASREHISFEATGTANTTMELGSFHVESVPLDLLLADEQPTYIKMDIEGAEYRALLGCRQVIAKHLPILAICLYHRQEDLWSIPLLVRSISDQYSLFLRRYSDECWEQVCYAVPKERVAL
jgi:FkbM family methyltransferase